MSDGVVICKDCGNPMMLDYQEQRNTPPLAIVTCKNPACTLWSVTLSVDVYSNLNDKQLTDYREMVAKLKQQFKNMRNK